MEVWQMMLSKKVEVGIYGVLSKGCLYSGYANGDGIKNMSAYIMSRRPVRDLFTGVIIAVVALSDSKETKLIVAPENDIFYEPEIREKLSRLKNLKIEKITCLYEKSCGGVIFYDSDAGTRLLFVKNHNGRYWSFPKGHIEEKENEKQTAIREIKEETNLDVKLIDNFREVSDYCPFGKIKKRVVFFLAQAFTDDVTVQASEIDSYIWVDLNDAKKLCCYDNDLRLVEKAEKRIKQIHSR